MVRIAAPAEPSIVRVTPHLTAIAPHASLTAAVPEDSEYTYPAGAGLARELESALRQAGFVTSEFDNWRDPGWSIDVRVSSHRLQVYFAALDERSWLLVIAPLDRVGIAGWLLGRRTPDTSGEVRLLARTVHTLLRSRSYVSDLSWQNGGPPDPAKAVPMPDDLDWA